MAKQKAQYPEDFKTMFGVSIMGLSQVFSTALITSYLMLYLTDYSGLYAGIAGKAAEVATVMVLIGRLWSAVNDPICGLIMDRSPRRKWGKFKPILFVAIPISTFLLIALFNIPTVVSDLVKVALMYVAYLLFDTLFSLLPIIPLTQSLSNDNNVRSKLLAAPRVVTLLVSMFTSSFLAVAIALGKDGNPNIGLAVIVFLAPLAALSMLGTALVKEGTNNVNEEKVKIRDFLAMFKVNKPLWISLLSVLFGGFVYTFIVAGIYYYIKYAFGAENLGTQSIIVGVIFIFSILLGVFAIQPILKRVTSGMALLISYLVSVVPLAVLWLVNLAGPITNLAIFYPLIFLAMLGIGMSYIPTQLIVMECMDYNKDKAGKSMEGSVNAMNSFIAKLQAALGGAITGAILVAVGYDAELYKNASTIPASLYSGLGFVMFALPAILGLVSAGILLFYPLLNKSKRDAIYAEIEKRKLQKDAAVSPES